jgi:hypothetical protein
MSFVVKFLCVSVCVLCAPCGKILSFYCIFQNPLYICPTNQIFLLVQECLVFIKKGGEIRLLETLATKPEISGERCQNLIPERPGDDKN